MCVCEVCACVKYVLGISAYVCVNCVVCEVCVCVCVLCVVCEVCSRHICIFMCGCCELYAHVDASGRMLAQVTDTYIYTYICICICICVL